MANVENENRAMRVASEFKLPALSHLQENENRISDYLENQLPAAERRALEEHLTVCAECQNFCQQLKQLDNALAQALARPELSSAFTTRLWQRIAEQATPDLSVARGQLRKQLEEEFQIRSAQLRKNILPLPELLEGVGYAAVAAIAAYLLVQLLGGLFANATQSPVLATADQTWLFAYAPAAICLLVGLVFALKRQFMRWLTTF
jgi:anti-sigma factor RsiW